MDDYAFRLEEMLSILKLPTNFYEFWLPVGMSSFCIIVFMHWLKRRRATAEEQYIDVDTDGENNPEGRRGKPKYRFRKRDKVMFYGRKFLRKINIINEEGSSDSRSGTVTPVNTGGRKVRKKVRTRPRVMDKVNNLAKLFRSNKPIQFPRTIKRPPAAFLEENQGPYPKVPEGLSPEVFWLLRNIRVFGNIQSQFIWEICKHHIEEVHISKGSYLFEPGMKDDSMYVVMKGKLAVYLRDGDKEYEMKRVGEGESVFSLLSVLDVMTGSEGVLKTAAAKAIEDCSVICLKGRGFREAFETNPEDWVRAVQIIMVRLLHVTMTTLHNYLGMSTELTKPSLRSAPQRTQKSRHYSGETGVHHRMLGDVGRRDSAPVGKLIKTPTSGGATSDEEGEGGIIFGLQGSGSGKLGSERNKAQRQLSAEKRIAMEQMARRAIGETLGLGDDLHLLDGKAKLESLPNNFEVVKQGDMDTYLIYVLSGCLELVQKSIVNDEMVLESVVWPQEMVGGLAVLSGEPSFFTMRARQKTQIVKISRSDFYDFSV